MEKQVTRLEMSEMLVKLDEAKETNVKLIAEIDKSLGGIGGSIAENREFYLMEKSKLAKVMTEQEELYKSIVLSLYNRVNK
tara:strand:+ start:1610 stop:1852 length:243 start_codon:yes stop_codon:yes gene_type:complete